MENKPFQTDSLHMARLASLGGLITGIVHEISNPLAVIRGCSQLLSSKKLPSDIQEDIDRIMSEAERCSDIIKNVLVFARKAEEVQEKYTVCELVEKACVLKRYSLKSNNINLRFVTEHRPMLTVYGNKAQMIQVILNILNNSEHAIKESSGEGTIDIRLFKKEDDALIDITDNGPGIESLKVNNIFDAYFTTKKEGEGTGLGLYLSREIVRKHNGNIKITDNNVGKTTFRIQLPLYKSSSTVSKEIEIHNF